MKSVLIVDDETPARAKAVRFFKKLDAQLELIQADHGEAALQLLVDRSFDLILLDIQMPGMTGFEVIEQADPSTLPPVVFATAFDEYAVAAFEAEAIDYLLKPFSFERFKKAVLRALDRQSGPTAADKPSLPVSGGSSLTHLPLRSGGVIKMIKTDDIISITSEDHYVSIETASGSFYERKSLQALESLLDPDKFVRIHRSALVNRMCISELHPLSHGDYILKLSNGSELNLSRRYTQNLGL